jgi:hypothetical protein
MLAINNKKRYYKAAQITPARKRNRKLRNKKLNKKDENPNKREGEC